MVLVVGLEPTSPVRAQDFKSCVYTIPPHQRGEGTAQKAAQG